MTTVAIEDKISFTIDNPGIWEATDPGLVSILFSSSTTTNYIKLDLKAEPSDAVSKLTKSVGGTVTESDVMFTLGTLVSQMVFELTAPNTITGYDSTNPTSPITFLSYTDPIVSTLDTLTVTDTKTTSTTPTIFNAVVAEEVAATTTDSNLSIILGIVAAIIIAVIGVASGIYILTGPSTHPLLKNRNKYSNRR